MKTADLVDAHDSLVRLCHLPFLRFGRRAAFFGPVAPLKCHEDNALLKAELQKPGNGRVMVVDAGGSTRVAVLGDILAQFLIDFGWAGAIIHGAIRDSAEIDQMDVAVRCLGVSPKKSAKHGAGTVGDTVRFGGVEFSPQSWVYADADGVLVADRELKLG